MVNDEIMQKLNVFYIIYKKEISGDENLSSLIFILMLIFIKDGVIILGYFKEEEKWKILEKLK